MSARLSLSLVLWLTVAGLGPSSAPAQQRRAPGSNLPLPAIEQVQAGRLDRLERWLKAAARHTPGEDDDELEEIAAWPNASLKELWVDANALAQSIRRGRGVEQFTVQNEGGKASTQVHYTKTQTLRLTALACAAGGMLTEPACLIGHAGDGLDPDLRQLALLARASRLRGDDNYILRRGALLHGDVAMIAPRAMAAPAESRSTPGPERFRMQISDGREIELRQTAVHWEIARMLLDYVKPDGSERAAPGRDEMVRQWYCATAAWMQWREDHERRHLDRARELFPEDPDLLVLSGFQRETFAGAPVQTAVRSAVLPTGVTVDVRSERAELREAEAFFQRALDLQPDRAEARMHHGRVLALLGRHLEAATELRRAAPALQDPQLQYYDELFLGAEEEALGNREAAAAAYEQAAVLAPRAQSPLLALSQLARRYGDRPGALRAIDRLFALAGEEPGRHDDPWWAYYVSQARDADDLLEAMEEPFRSERLK